MTDTERLARIGELLRVRSLIVTTHEEQLERFDGRLRALYPADFLAVVGQAEAQGTEPPDFLTWYAAQAVVDSGLWHPTVTALREALTNLAHASATDTSTWLPLWALPLPSGDNVDPTEEWARYAPGGGTDTDSIEGDTW